MFFKYFDYVANFKDPASVYAQSLILVHNNVMWFLVFIIVIVYYILYKILKDSLWSSFNKQSGASKIIYSHPIFLQINAYIFWIYANIASFFVYHPRSFLKRTPRDSYKDFIKPLTVSYLASSLFEYTNRGLYLYNNVCKISPYDSKYSEFFSLLNFKHSTELEVVWATFPTAIIVDMLIPSVFLIYSVDEILHPNMTIKVIGHQWYWSYDLKAWSASPKGYGLVTQLAHTQFLLKTSADDLSKLRLSTFLQPRFIDGRGFTRLEPWFRGDSNYDIVDNIPQSDLHYISIDTRKISKATVILSDFDYISDYFANPSRQGANPRTHIYEYLLGINYKVHEINMDDVPQTFSLAQFYDARSPKETTYHGHFPRLDYAIEIKKNSILPEVDDFSFALNDTAQKMPDIGYNSQFSSYSFDSCLVIESSLQLGQARLLVTDKPLVLYRGYSYRFLVTSEDVLHAWSVPELGVKVDAVPGRTNQYLAAPNRVGVFYGQCSEICGVGHGFMPITIKVTNLKKDGW